jgi:hypothetical protein
MGDDHHHRLRLRAVYASHRRARLQVLDGLEAIGQVDEPEVGDLSFGGFVALAGPLRCAAWPPRFKLDISACYDGTSDPVGFLQRYAADVQAAGGDGRVMANWFPWLRRESLAGGSAGCPRGPSHPGGISVSASSTGTHPWDLSQRVRRRMPPSMAPSPGA